MLRKTSCHFKEAARNREFSRKAPSGVYMNSRFEASAKNPYKQEETMQSADNLMQEKLFTPELLDLRSFALNLNRLVHYGYHSDTGIIEKYASRAIELASTMKSRDYAMTLNSFAKAGYTNSDNLIATYCKTMTPRLIHFIPLEIGLVLNALTKLGKDHPSVPAFLKSLVDEIPHKLDSFEPDNLAQTVHALARLGYTRDKLLISDITTHFIKHSDKYDSQSLFMVMNAFGRFVRSVPVEPEFWDAAMRRAILVDLEPHMPALMLTAVAAAKHSSPVVLEFSSEMARQSNNLPMTMSALAKLGMFGSRLPWKNMIEEISRSENLHSRDALQVLHAIARRGVGDATDLAIRIIGNLEICSLNELSLVAYAQARLEITAPDLLEKATRLLSDEKAISTVTLATIAYSFKKIADSSLMYYYIFKGFEGASDVSVESMCMAMAGFAERGAIAVKLREVFEKIIKKKQLTASEANRLLVAKVEWSKDVNELLSEVGSEEVVRYSVHRDKILEGLEV